jgi:hypothetical protein
VAAALAVEPEDGAVMHEARGPGEIFEPLFVGGQYICPVCKRSHATKFNAVRHYRHNHEADPRPHFCEVCEASFDTLAHFNCHTMGTMGS